MSTGCGEQQHYLSGVRRFQNQSGYTTAADFLRCHSCFSGQLLWRQEMSKQNQNAAVSANSEPANVSHSDDLPQKEKAVPGYGSYPMRVPAAPARYGLMQHPDGGSGAVVVLEKSQTSSCSVPQQSDFSASPAVTTAHCAVTEYHAGSADPAPQNFLPEEDQSQAGIAVSVYQPVLKN